MIRSHELLVLLVSFQREKKEGGRGREMFIINNKFNKNVEKVLILEELVLTILLFNGSFSITKLSA